ncbi:MAG: hypothetical protein HC886_06730 [Leptolyngbyaceae cyanobacterium SM1_1_3]|nr:hypothetical protein [Leptolyngbyaceae cyanobacterium SM1_1_3]
MSRSQWFTAVTVIACSGATLFLRGQPRIVSAAKQRMAEIMPLGTAFRQQLSNTQQMLIFLTQKLARSPASKTSIALSDSLSQSEVTLGGVGPLRLGMTLEEATQVTSNLLIPQHQRDRHLPVFSPAASFS